MVPETNDVNAGGIVEDSKVVAIMANPCGLLRAVWVYKAARGRRSTCWIDGWRVVGHFHCRSMTISSSRNCSIGWIEFKKNTQLCLVHSHSH